MSEHHPIEDAFIEEEMHLAGIHCRAVKGGPTDFDRVLQEHLDRIVKKRENQSGPTVNRQPSAHKY